MLLNWMVTANLSTQFYLLSEDRYIFNQSSTAGLELKVSKNSLHMCVREDNLSYKKKLLHFGNSPQPSSNA